MEESGPVFRRRPRYRGSHPRRFEEKYKELDPLRDPETVAKVLASGKTPAGWHRPILLNAIVERLAPGPNERGADVTLGYGGHSEALLEQSDPSVQLLTLDVDTKQLPLTEARLRARGYGEERLHVKRSNFAGLRAVLIQLGWADGLDFILADLGLSSMQIDNPSRGFSYKHDGPLDMRMNPARGASARDWLSSCGPDKLAKALVEGADEPRAVLLADAIVAESARAPIESTGRLKRVIESALKGELDDEAIRTTVARVFQAIRIAVNDEFTALDTFLQGLPGCLRAGGRVAILSFHSGEDRRVKQSFREGLRTGLYAEVASEVIRPTAEEVRSNTRAASAKMRWAVRSSLLTD